jgi:heptosyltransferase III
LKPPKSILVIVTRRIGDVLLTTPLIRSLKLAWPDAAVDVLVFSGTEGVLSANSDLRKVITVPENARDKSHLTMLFSLTRRYDLSISTLPGDRPTFYAWLTGRHRIGFILSGAKNLWKRLMLSHGTFFDDRNTHTVLMNLALADLLGIQRNYNVVVDWKSTDRERVECLLPNVLIKPYAILHIFPKYNYKMWCREGWLEIARWLTAQGIDIVLTGGKDLHELAYIASLQQHMPSGTTNIAGKLSLAELAFLISKAKIYVGPDTAVTHMAAALGVPTVALYGPTNIVKWGPWPKGYEKSSNPFSMRGSQTINNVALLQGGGSCVPCMEEGCNRHIASASDCLLLLPPEKVIEAMAKMMNYA